MLDFEFCSPTRIAFGRGAENKVGALAKREGATRALVVYGGGSAVRSGLTERVTKSLRDADITVYTLGGVRPNPTDDKVYEGIELARAHHVDFVMGVGGASAIDTGKAIAAGVCYEGDFFDLYLGASPVLKALPHGAVVTIAAAGSEASNSSVITRASDRLKRGTRTDLNRPRFAALNPELTFTLPQSQKAYGAADIMAHVFERYFTNTRDVRLTDRLCEALLETVLEAAPRAIRDPLDYASHADLMWAGTLAHNDVAGAGREQDWGAHAMSMDISSRYGVAHGAALASLFPAWMRFQLDHDPARFAQLAVRVFGVEPDFAHPSRVGALGIERLEAFYKSLGLKLSLREMGVPEEDIPALAAHVQAKNAGRVGFFSPLSRRDVEAVYRMAWAGTPTRRPASLL